MSFPPLLDDDDSLPIIPNPWTTEVDCRMLGLTPCQILSVVDVNVFCSNRPTPADLGLYDSDIEDSMIDDRASQRRGTLWSPLCDLLLTPDLAFMGGIPPHFAGQFSWMLRQYIVENGGEIIMEEEWIDCGFFEFPGDWRERFPFSKSSQLRHMVDALAAKVLPGLPNFEQHERLYYPRLVLVEFHIPQPLHVDFHELPDDPVDFQWILHMLLCREGMRLAVTVPWSGPEGRRIVPAILFIPFGTFLVLRGDVPYGGFYGGSAGNEGRIGNYSFQMTFKSLV